MDLHFQSTEIVMEIKQEYKYSADDEIDRPTLVKLDDSCSYTKYDDDCNGTFSIKVEGVSDEFDSTTPIFECTEGNRAAVKHEIEDIKDKSCVGVAILHQTLDSSIKFDSGTSGVCSSPLEGMKDEQIIEIGESFKLSADTKQCIKVEKDPLAIDEQESETYMDSTELEVLAEELNIKPDSDIRDYENSDAELNRGAQKKITGKERRAVCSKAEKTLFICYHCNFIVHSKKDLIFHINAGGCSSKGCVKKTVIVHRRSNKSNEYICAECHKVFKSVTSSEDHIIKKHAELISYVSSKIHQCEHCSYKTTNTNHLARHLTKHPETGCSVEQMSCIHCDATFKTVMGLDDHIIKNHKESVASVSSKIYPCERCSYKTTISTALARHMTKHPETGCSIKQSHCIHCDAAFNSKRALDEHLIKKHELIGSVLSIIHHCKHCSYKTTFSSNLARHMARRHPESGCSVKPTLRICIHCDKTFKSQQALDDHVIKSHEEFIASVTSKIHQCEYCSYKTTCSDHLASHMNKHPGSACSVEPKRSPCIHCDRIFKTKRDLDDHVIRYHEEFIAHVSSKIHQCKYCNYKTVNSSHLARHMTKHPESGCSVKRMPCIHCDAIFKTKNRLDDHVIKKHEESIASVSSKIQQCEHCSYKTTITDYLARHTKKHLKTVRGIKPIPCIHCDATFKTKSGLDDHVIRNHKESIASVSSKIYECEHCSYKTTISSHLASHMTKHA